MKTPPRCRKNTLRLKVSWTETSWTPAWCVARRDDELTARPAASYHNLTFKPVQPLPQDAARVGRGLDPDRPSACPPSY